jgi:hypothetical protein
MKGDQVLESGRVEEDVEKAGMAAILAQERVEGPGGGGALDACPEDVEGDVVPGLADGGSGGEGGGVEGFKDDAEDLWNEKSGHCGGKGRGQRRKAMRGRKAKGRGKVLLLLLFSQAAVSQSVVHGEGAPPGATAVRERRGDRGDRVALS